MSSSQPLSKVARSCFGKFTPVASQSSFSSVASAPRHSKLVTRPKFPIPRYGGKSEPTPTNIISSVPPPNQQIDSLHQHQNYIANTLRPFFESRTPLLLQNLLGACDAIYFWRSLEYWRVAVGEDTPVDVEIGKGYNRGGNRATMMFGEYLNYLVLSIELEQQEYEQYNYQDGMETIDSQQIGDHEVAYLAQNELFHQVKHDIIIPKLCENGEYNVYN